MTDRSPMSGVLGGKLHPDPVVEAVVIALLENDGRRSEQVEQPWIWTDEMGDDLSYIRAAEVAVAAVRALASDESTVQS